jgi:hypothetical protein
MRKMSVILVETVLLLQERGQAVTVEVCIAGGRHRQRHLAVGVHGLIKPIKPSHLRASVSDPRVVEI